MAFEIPILFIAQKRGHLMKNSFCWFPRITACHLKWLTWLENKNDGVALAWSINKILFRARSVVFPGLLLIPTTTFAQTQFDVIAEVSSRGEKVTVATVRSDEVSCISHAGVWLGMTRTGNDVWFQESVTGIRILITADAIENWKQIRTQQIQDVHAMMAKIKAATAFPQETKDVLKKYSDPTLTGVKVPALKMTASYPIGSTPAPQIQALNARLQRLRADLQKEVPNIELAYQQFTCIYEFENLPAKLVADATGQASSLVSVPVPTPVGKVAQRAGAKPASGVDLARLFSVKSRIEAPVTGRGR